MKYILYIVWKLHECTSLVSYVFLVQFSDPTLAIVTFDCEEAVEEALKWDGKDFNHQPMYIRRLNTNNKYDMDMLKVVLNDGTYLLCSVVVCISWYFTKVVIKNN